MSLLDFSPSRFLWLVPTVPWVSYHCHPSQWRDSLLRPVTQKSRVPSTSGPRPRWFNLDNSGTAGRRDSLYLDSIPPLFSFPNGTDEEKECESRRRSRWVTDLSWSLDGSSFGPPESGVSSRTTPSPVLALISYLLYLKFLYKRYNDI